MKLLLRDFVIKLEPRAGFRKLYFGNGEGDCCQMTKLSQKSGQSLRINIYIYYTQGASLSFAYIKLQLFSVY